jgi:glycosyltransferase involved in cell wall biosynthesis
MKIAFLSRYQNKVERGAENFVKELSFRLERKHSVDILRGKDADSLIKVLKGDYDIIIPINGRFQSLKMSLGRFFKKYKLLISGHSGKGKDDIWNIIIARPSIFITLTDDMTNWAKKWAFGIKIAKISDGVDINKFTPNGVKLSLGLEKPVILSVGALTWYKHHEKAIEAVALLEKGSLLVVGDGPGKDKLKEMGERKLGKRFKIMNFAYSDMPKVYRSCDLFTLPSWDREAFGIVYLEALASGLGVVAPDDLSRREIINEAGILIDVDNAKLYRDALEKAVEINWQKKALEQASKFSWDKIASEYEDIMKNILKND